MLLCISGRFRIAWSFALTLKKERKSIPLIPFLSNNAMRYSFIQENLTPVILCASLLVPIGIFQYYLYTLGKAHTPHTLVCSQERESKRARVRES